MEKIKILFADDHGVVRSGLRALFKSSPEFMIVGEASDGEQAIRLAEKCNPDIVLLDITMPRVNGIEATQAIKRNNPDTRVLILTARGGMHDAERGMDAGADDYMTKPFSTKDLVARVRALLGDPVAR